MQDERSDTFCAALRAFLLAIAGEYLHETSTKPLGVLTHLSTALLPSSHCHLLLTLSFSGQLSQADCSLLASFVNWLSRSSQVAFLSSSTSGLMLWPFVWVSRQNRQRDPLCGANTNGSEYYPHTHMISSIPILY